MTAYEYMSSTLPNSLLSPSPKMTQKAQTIAPLKSMGALHEDTHDIFIKIRDLVETPQHKRKQIIKRMFDVIVSGAALVALSPAFAIIALLIKKESFGPAFFQQERWGKDLKPIKVLKFRTMYADRGDTTGVEQTVEDDDRITPLGKILRRLSLDELPQLLNVFRGDMSLVGPRCHPIGMKAAGVLYEELVPDYHARHLVRPGITGLAQVNGFRGPTTDKDASIERINHDLQYISSQSIIYDFKLLLQTCIREFRGGTGS